MIKNLNRWVYAIVGVIVLLVAGLVYAWTTMGKSIAASRPDWSAAQLSLTFTLVMAFFCIGCLIAGIFARKIKPMLYVILSGILFVIGFYVASLTGESPALLYVGFGVFGGLGAGFAYNAVMSTMSKWFPDKQGLISGVLLMGFGLSAFIVGKLFAAIAPDDGSETWKTVFRVMGIIIVILLVICSLFFVNPPEGYAPATGSTRKKAVREPATEMNTGQMMKKPAFWCYYVWAILVSAAGLVLVSQAAGIASQVGTEVAAGTIATVVGLISIFNAVGRVFFGMFFDKKGFAPTMILDMIIFVVASVIIILAITSSSFILIVIGFIVGGFAYGGVTPTNSAIISDFFGRKHYPINFSIINTNLLIASFASTIAGSLKDSTGSYLATIYMMIGVVIAGAIVFIGVRRPRAK